MTWLTNGHAHLQRIFPLLSGLRVLIFILFSAAAYASVERITRYEYDGAGNIVRVFYEEQSEALSINQLTPAFVNRGNTAQITATGDNLLGAEVLTDVEGLTIRHVTASSDQVTFTITASTQALLGNAALRVVTGVGETQTAVIVADVIPVLHTQPAPIAISPSTPNTRIRLMFAHPRPEDETYTVSISDPTIATHSETTFTVLAGEREAELTLNAVTDGITTLNISLANKFYFYEFPVYVNKRFIELVNEYPDMQQRGVFSDTISVHIQSPNQSTSNTAISTPVGVNMTREGEATHSLAYTQVVGVTIPEPTQAGANAAYSQAVGITVLESNQAGNSAAYSPVIGVAITDNHSAANSLAYSQPIGVAINNASNTSLSDPVGTTIGALLHTIQPNTVFINSTVTLEVGGVNLQDVQQVNLSPSDGMTLGIFTVNSAGTLLSIPLTIESHAPAGTYELRLTTSQGLATTRSGLPLTLTIQ
ncbi:hypothetical protein AB835_03665 [Candidatus Endobugula sertula]|uniref:Uncharacterized protein n=1 Tax=Candidatus Endobugula sertula TaxID=62101 RepID=A0A1D2QS34_9GAMM|nr:hypothetical protein AB835_03665 [Candidatus Endobugula sertula]